MPRKSTSSIPPTDGEEASGTPTTGMQTTEQQLKAQADGLGVEDLLLPRSVTQRLAKSVLPPNTTIQKDALLAIQKAATVFVSYLSSHANEATLKRTLAPSDVLSALSELEFESMRPRLERELDAHTEAQADKKRATKEKKAAVSDASPENASKGLSGDGKDEESKIRETKRVKRDSDGLEKTIPIAVSDETEVEEADEDETEHIDEVDDEEGEEEEEEEEESDEGDETQEAEDPDRVEDLDPQDTVENSDSEDDDDGPAAQLRSNMGLG